MNTLTLSSFTRAMKNATGGAPSSALAAESVVAKAPTMPLQALAPANVEATPAKVETKPVAATPAPAVQVETKPVAAVEAKPVAVAAKAATIAPAPTAKKGAEMGQKEDLLAKRNKKREEAEAAEREWNEFKAGERANVIAKMREDMAEYEITAADLSDKPARAPRGTGTGKSGPRAPAAIKYKNKDTGETWTGRGQRPRWLKAALDTGGKKLEDFAL